ncbi:M20 family metallopeptidase [Deinococcus detaillensis]|uniref:Probable succinyl-diaminopimelate desuccinylase n=1 Tax=Deinococcus detaillensis TaxID=2592048 RepID=A0A553UNH1_9DEIO|nr:ArgE/DapE family deacylase [Deinococcus detaillensis]TSA81735.1 M20 family metallopeptidase [Deinococcus detaillensis]
MTELTELLKTLISIPSTNPTGDSRSIAQFVAQWLQEIGGAVQVLAPSEKPEAQSVVARVGEGSPVIMLHAHTDTVPVTRTEAAAWTSDPFVGVERNGNMYGKGSVDDKGTLAAMMITFKKLCAHRPNGTLILVAASEEKVGGQLGTRWLVQTGHLPLCDLIVVGAQTFNRVATVHKGVMRATVTTRGRSAHATNPDRGINAINAMARVILTLEDYHRQLAQHSHPMTGNPTCNIGVITGGSTANAVADQCTIELDRRMVPGEEPLQVQRELEQLVLSAQIAPSTAEIGGFLYSSWFEAEIQTELGQAFLEYASHYTNTPVQPVGYWPGSDAKHLTELARGDMVIFGAGSYEAAHAADEYVSIAELTTCEAVLSGFLSRTLLAGGLHV